MTAFKVVIPARYGSTRLPGKPLRLLAGKPVLQRVYQQALASAAEAVVIATDDPRIEQAAQAWGATVCMTRPDHTSGTERIAEVAAQLGWSAEQIVVNVQGDEPLLPPPLIQQVASNLAACPSASIATLCAAIDNSQQLFDPSVVKVVLDQQGFALYFSRAPIPWDRQHFPLSKPLPLPPGRYLRHIGLYAYRVGFLQQYQNLAVTELEQVELLEQLRALWHGAKIQVAVVDTIPAPGVDTEADLQHLELLLSRN